MDIELEIQNKDGVSGNAENSNKEEIVYKKFTKEEIEAKQKELNSFKEVLQEKLYLVSDDLSLGKDILNWLQEKVSWSYSESIGVVKLYDTLNEMLKNPKTNKLYLRMGEITAINYLLQKTNGNGYYSAKEVFKIVQPIIEVLNTSINQDSKKVQELEFELASMNEGIVPYTQTEKENEDEDKTTDEK